MVDAGRTPTVYVDAHKEQENNQQQWAPIKPDHDPPIRILVAVSNAYIDINISNVYS